MGNCSYIYILFIIIYIYISYIIPMSSRHKLGIQFIAISLEII